MILSAQRDHPCLKPRDGRIREVGTDTEEPPAQQTGRDTTKGETMTTGALAAFSGAELGPHTMEWSCCSGARALRIALAYSASSHTPCIATCTPCLRNNRCTPPRVRSSDAASQFRGISDARGNGTAPAYRSSAIGGDSSKTGRVVSWQWPETRSGRRCSCWPSCSSKDGPWWCSRCCPGLALPDARPRAVKVAGTSQTASHQLYEVKSDVKRDCGAAFWRG
jgi:hypothetical protein